MRLQFGDFIVDDDVRQLLRAGTVVHLSPKAFDLLILLIGERPRALRKQDLHARLWPDTFVSDASLAMLVAEIRSALGETARHPSFVRTLHRHGYAFQAEAREVVRKLPVLAAVASTTPHVVGYWLVTSSRQIPLLAGDNIIGRDPNARVWLDSPSVSRQHACIHIEGDRVTLEDLGSKNGTRARDCRLTTITALSDGDQLRFGSVNASFRVWSVDPTRTEAGPT